MTATDGDRCGAEADDDACTETCTIYAYGRISLERNGTAIIMSPYGRAAGPNFPRRGEAGSVIVTGYAEQGSSDEMR